MSRIPSIRPESSRSRIPRPGLHGDPEVDVQLLKVFEVRRHKRVGSTLISVWCKVCGNFFGPLDPDGSDGVAFLLHATGDIVHRAILCSGSGILPTTIMKDLTKTLEDKMEEDPYDMAKFYQIYCLDPEPATDGQRYTMFCRLCRWSQRGTIRNGWSVFKVCSDHAATNHNVVLTRDRGRDQTQMEEYIQAVCSELPFYEDLAVPHLQQGQTKMEEGQTKMEDDETQMEEYDEDNVKAVFSELPFHEDLADLQQGQAKMEEGQTKMEKDEYVNHSVKPDGVTSTAPISSSDFSEDQLHKLFKLISGLGLTDELKQKFSVVCKVCGSIADHIQEGSNLVDCRAAQQHVQFHLDFLFDEVTPVEGPEITVSYSEEELLRIYFVDSYKVPSYKRSIAPPLEEPVVVWYGVVCKLCKWEVYKTPVNPVGCLHEISKLHVHGVRHSEYMCMDGPPVPELGPADSKEVKIGDDDYGLPFPEDGTPVPEGFVKVCCWCECENCSSGEFKIVRLWCDVCDDFGYHRTVDCLEHQEECGVLIPCDGQRRKATTLLGPLQLWN